MQNYTSFGLQVKNVHFSLGKKLILDTININIPEGKTTGILGPNGAGKSSLLSLLIGLHKPSLGSIASTDASLIVGSRNYRAKLGVVMQETALYDELSVQENLSFSAALYDVNSPQKKILEILTLLGMEERKNDVLATLSGGMQRRVTIARALLHDPALLIVDEPTLGVDAEARHIIWSYLRLLQSQGTTIIISTNYLDEVLALCDSVCVLGNGKLISSLESPEKLLRAVGKCIDVFSTESIPLEKLAAIPGVSHIEKTFEGVSLFMTKNAKEESITRVLMESYKITGFKVRAPDLSELFHYLEKNGHE
jgi:ABC-2 type transport system ATP-binding protein